MSGPLPRLAVVSDVPPARATAGELLAYRLLADYPPDRLRVVEGGPGPTPPSRRLPGVRYDRVRSSVPRLTRTRLRPAVNAALTAAAPLLARTVAARLAGFRPEAILTVAHGHLWLAAAAVARRWNLPLHVLAHDLWPTSTPVPAWAINQAERVAVEVGRQATTWLCVSPGMADHVRRRYGATATVLYPCRGDDSPPPRVRVRPDWSGVAAYAGTLWGGGYADQLAALAAALAPLGGRVDVYAPQPLGRLGAVPNVRAAGFLPPRQLADRLAATADLLFCPMSFVPADRAAMAAAFPSKLADYTAVGLPLFISGPADCGAVRWATDHPGAAEVVTSPTADAFGEVVRRLAADPLHRRTLAERAVEAGDRFFHPAAARAVLRAALTASPIGRTFSRTVPATPSVHL